MRVNSTVGWEPRTRALLRRLLQQTTGTVFEAGAHVGDHLLPLAAAFPNLRFVGLDPDPSKVAFVERMVAANALANVRVVTAALDAAPRDDCGLDRSDANAGASSGASAAARSTLACNPPERDSGHAIAPPGLTPRELAECGLSLEAREAAISALEDALAKKRRF